MEIKTAFSTKSDMKDMTDEIARSLIDRPTLIVFFASPKYDLESLGRSLESKYRGTTVLGCSTSGELVSGKMADGSVVAIGLPKDLIKDAAVATINGLSRADGVTQALSVISQKIGKDVRELDPREYVGVVLIDGLRSAEERIMDSLGNACDITWIGGSAGDDLAFKQTMVFANGKAATDSAVLALLHVPNGFDILKTQSFTPTGIKMIATEVDEASRTVVSFDGKPAAKRYAEVLGVSLNGLAGKFMESPVGLMANGEPFVRSPQRLDGDKIVFYCNIKQGTELQVLRSGDIVMDTRRDLMENNRKAGRPKAIINFNCILRTLELKSKDQTDAYGQIFNNVPTIGFSTYGEEYIGHINQTATMLLLK
jgi:hypothetical protein